MSSNERQADRVTYSFNMKVPGQQEYSSVGFSASMSSDVKKGETVEDAFERIREIVMSEIEKDHDSYG